MIDPCIAGHQGRIFKTTGDGLLAEFPSVIDAVRCAVAMQRKLAEANRGVDANRRMIFRVGVHLGDVVADGDDLLGDGVNLASRIERAAEPGGVCISSAVHEHVRDRLPQLALRDGGEREMRNLPRPVRVFEVVADVPPAASAPEPAWRARSRLVSAVAAGVAVCACAGAASAARDAVREAAMAASGVRRRALYFWQFCLDMARVTKQWQSAPGRARLHGPAWRAPSRMGRPRQAGGRRSAQENSKAGRAAMAASRIRRG